MTHKVVIQTLSPDIPLGCLSIYGPANRPQAGYADNPA